MGNADSKAAAEEDGTFALNTTAPQKNNSREATDSSSSTPEKREANDKNSSNRNGGVSNRDGGSGGGGGEHSPIKKNAAKNPISDDQINVNMPMADLMAYLQVVANNSNHLPLTRRDDPELDRTVSSLTSEDYARKSAAFVPSDVRVIGGTFSRYGRVWDLPTSEEYNACDGAHEPGRSYGGACCNTMLKVVYDAANEMEGAAQTEAAAQALFDDDEEDDDEPSVMGKSYRSGASLEYGNLSQSQITWAQMLRQMKSEFKEIGYSQAPKITTTRKIDLNRPFSLQGETFEAKKNKKRSLLIGCNYRNSNGAELKASHDDIRSMKDYIVNVHGFSESSDLMTILLDDENHAPPTFNNIIEALKTISEQAMPGDAVFVQFAGHGGRVLDAALDSEAESYDEVIVPADYTEYGLIRDTLLFKTLLAPMRYGVTVTIIVDCCDTGMVMELPYSWTTKSDKRDSVAKLSMNEDFSFVRFLKVVKTLYESSTFTQLGKTVGSALNPLSIPSHINDDESRKSGRSQKHKTSQDRLGAGHDSFFDALTDACRGKTPLRDDPTLTKSNDSAIEVQTDNIFVQMLNGCSILTSPAEDEDFSDEDTFKTRTEEDLSYFSGGESYDDTMATEEDYSRHRRRSSRSKRRR